MQTKVINEQPFQTLTGSFSIGPSPTGYQLEISADGYNYSPLFSVGANITRLVTNVAAGSYYRLKNNEGEVIVNWQKSCGGEGGGGEYILPVATADVLGGVKIGSGITIDSEGHISAQGGGAGDMDKLVPVSELPESAADGTVLALAESAGTEYGVYQAQGVAPDFIWENYDGSTTGWTAFRTNFCDFNYNSVFEYADENGVEICKFTVNWTSDEVGIYNVQGDYACTVTKNADNDYTVVADGEPSSAHVYVEDGYGYIMLDNMYFLSDVWGDGVRSAQIGTENPHGGETNWVKIGEMPVASETVLGGIKVGSGLAIAADGTLSASGSSYELPPATQSTLGGVKVGAGLDVDSAGTLSVENIGEARILKAMSTYIDNPEDGDVVSYIVDGTPNAGDGITTLAVSIAQYEARKADWGRITWYDVNDDPVISLYDDNGTLYLQKGSDTPYEVSNLPTGRWGRYSGTLYYNYTNGILAFADTGTDLAEIQNSTSNVIHPVIPKIKDILAYGGIGGNGSWVNIDLNGHGIYDKDIDVTQRFYQMSGPTGSSYGFNVTMENGKSINFVWDSANQVFIVGNETGATLDIAETASAPRFYGVVQNSDWYAVFISSDDESLVAQVSQIDGYTGFVDIYVRLNNLGNAALVRSGSVTKIWRGTQAEYEELYPSDDTIYIILSE